MKKGILLLFLQFAVAHSYSQLNDSRIQDELIVMLRPDVSIENLSLGNNITIKECLSKSMKIWLLKKNSGVFSEEELTAVKMNSAIKLAQYNHTVTRRSLVPNDPNFNLQWNMLNPQHNHADIDATEAWAVNHTNVTVTGDTIVVAVIDQMFDLNHEDINFFTNYNEIPNNNFDDDHNGYIDDYQGWNVVTLTGNVNSTASDANHSTHISGVVGGIGNNNKGIAGTCWGVKILPVGGYSGAILDEAHTVAAYDYVIEMRKLYDQTSGRKGAFIVATNSSFGIDNAMASNFPIWCAMYDTMGLYGILSAGATANNAVDVDQVGDMPTTCPSKYLIAVTNTEASDHLNTGAAWGKVNIDLGAPGTGIYSTLPGNTYGSLTGTSQATPHVAGTIAAMYAYACPQLVNDYIAHPDSIALIIKKMLLDGTDRISDLVNRTTSGGRLNLYKAIRNTENYNCNKCTFNPTTKLKDIVCKGDHNGTAGIISNNNSVYKWSNNNLTSFDSLLAKGYYSVTVSDTSTHCIRVVNFSINEPDTIIVQSVTTTPIGATNPGNIIVNATAGYDSLFYSLDGTTYQTNHIFSVTTASNYTVYLKNSNGCIVQKSVTVTGIENLQSDFSFDLFPNPATDVLQVSFHSSLNSALELVVYNLQGQKLLTKQIAPTLQQETIDVSAWQSGMYILSLLDNNKQIAWKKFAHIPTR